MKRALVLLVSLIPAVLIGCASKPPFDTGGIDTSITPSQAVAKETNNARVLWGGEIVQTTNMKDATQIEVVGFPLDKKQEPNTNTQPIGRFLIVQPGYLESAEYAPGRRITVAGPVTGQRAGRIGEREYTYPVVAPDKIHLWPPEGQASSEPRVHFGIGVGAIFH